jgi:hypothetical protein
MLQNKEEKQRHSTVAFNPNQPHRRNRHTVDLVQR